ncbi:MAG: hypothetical protein KAX49_15390 [Halanaerobiales bacterium]|nr:hypothetical protein [Halanaerobiales bacterium]
MKETKESNNKHNFYINVNNSTKQVYQDPIADFSRLILDELLNQIVLTYKGKEVKVDGYYLNHDKETIYNIFKK